MTPATREDAVSTANGHESRERRAARNQALFRAVNEKIRAVNSAFGELTGSFTVACECSDPGCLEMLSIDADTYDWVRRSPYTFVVLRNHVDPAVERVVRGEGVYVVVEMPGQEARRLLEAAATAMSQAEDEG